MAWFDQSDNSVGALSVRLTGDAANVQGVGLPSNSTCLDETVTSVCNNVVLYSCYLEELELPSRLNSREASDSYNSRVRSIFLSTRFLFRWFCVDDVFSMPLAKT